MNRRFVPIVTARRENPYRVFDRRTGESFAGTACPERARTLALEFERKFNHSRRARFVAFITGRPLPQPQPENEDNRPEWLRRLERLSALIQSRKQPRPQETTP